MSARPRALVRRDERLLPHSFLAKLSDVHRARLRAAGVARSFRRGARPIVEGTPVTHVLLIEDGWIKVSVGDQDIEIRGPGDFAGNGGFADGTERHTITCVTPVIARLRSAAEFASFAESAPEIFQAVNYTLAARVDQAYERLVRAGMPAPRRLALLLLDVAAMARTADADLPLSAEELASLIRASRRTVTRCVTEWRSQGIVSLGYRAIRVRDRSALAEMAGSVR